MLSDDEFGRTDKDDEDKDKQEKGFGEPVDHLFGTEHYGVAGCRVNVIHDVVDTWGRSCNWHNMVQIPDKFQYKLIYTRMMGMFDWYIPKLGEEGYIIATKGGNYIGDDGGELHYYWRFY